LALKAQKWANAEGRLLLGGRIVMSIQRSTLVVALCLAPASVLADGSGPLPDPPLHVDRSVDDCSVQLTEDLSQAEFARFAREFGSVSSFKGMAPPTPLGRWGFSLGIEAIYFHVEEHSGAWNDSFVHPDERHELGSDKYFPKLHLQVGVADALDLGIYYTENPNANYGWLGLEAKYALLRQAEDMPMTLAVRGAYTETLYVESLDMHTVTVDVTAGRTFWGVLTPYLGVGNDFIIASESSDVVELDTETQLAPHALVGVQARYWHLALGGEIHVATVPTYQLQVAAVF
jgi:hypothetical protein